MPVQGFHGARHGELLQGFEKRTDVPSLTGEPLCLEAVLGIGWLGPGWSREIE